MQRHINTNQRMILEHSKSSREIFLVPTPPPGGGGNIEHYYHFIFDLILPLYLLVSQTPPNVIFVIKEFGIFSKRTQSIFPNRIIFKEGIDFQKNMNNLPLEGMNPKFVNLKPVLLESFRSYMNNTLLVEQTKHPNKILLIERLPPDPYYLTKANKKGSGTFRRSITNHNVLRSTLQSIVRAPFEFHNLQLEKISLKEQVEYFNKALLVIGQHGAGLVNCIWMRPKSVVVELSENEKSSHFRIISKIKSHNYFMYETFGMHPEIYINKFVSWIKDAPLLRSFFD